MSSFTFTFPESVVFWSAVLLALGLLRPYVPPWAALAGGEVFSLYWLARVLDGEPRAPEIVKLIFGVTVSVLFWWRYVRGREWWKSP